MRTCFGQQVATYEEAPRTAGFMDLDQAAGEPAWLYDHQFTAGDYPHVKCSAQGSAWLSDYQLAMAAAGYPASAVDLPNVQAETLKDWREEGVAHPCKLINTT